MKKRFLALMMALACMVSIFCSGCGGSERPQTDVQKQQEIANKLEQNQPTPTDIDYSLERYNLSKRAYWVNGQREKAMNLPCPVVKPIGYVVLMLDGVGIVASFCVEGKVSSLNSFLTPDSEYYEQEYGSNGYSYGDGNNWLADVDGSYGENDTGIFFFTNDGKYIEWNGKYLYSDIPFIVNNPILSVQGG